MVTGSVTALASENSVRGNQLIKIWGQKVPGPVVEGIEEVDNGESVYSVCEPTLEVFAADESKRVDTAVIVCPGGGYGGLAIEKEGYKVAKWFNSIGVTAFVLRYRVKEYGYPWPMCDLQQAIRVVRSSAKEFKIDADKVGVIGFSAGGHLVSSISVHWRHDFLTDGEAKENLRPDFTILGYPVISFQSDIRHTGSMINLLGKEHDAQMENMLSNELHVDSKTPPAFLFHAGDDAAVPVENSVRYYTVLNKAGVDAQLHIFDKGGHGFGPEPVREELALWKKLCENWMKNIGMLQE
ncbi:MAG: alpha/beta hydrolase [Sedimentisphaeraceae bacterium JB056]